MRPQIKVREFYQPRPLRDLRKTVKATENRANKKDTSENPKVLQEKRSQDKECVALPGVRSASANCSLYLLPTQQTWLPSLTVV